MPELPEVETVRRGLAPAMEGAAIQQGRGARPPPALADRQGFRQADRGQDRRRPRPAREISAGRSVVRRRAADASRHVGLVPRRQGCQSPASTIMRSRRARRTTMSSFTCRTAQTVTFNDPRRFGSMKLVPRAKLDSEPLLRALGPEPLGNEFDAAMLARACAGKKTSLKAALLRPARRRRPRQHLCLRGAVIARGFRPSGRPPPSPTATDKPNERAASAGRRHQGRAQRRDQGRRLVVCATIAAPTARSAISSTISASMTARASRARIAKARSNASCKTAARRSTVRRARNRASRAGGPP